MGSETTLATDGTVASSEAKPRFHRIEWLDGVRACAALFVVLHHTYIQVFPAFPTNTGPTALGFLMYGHLAVVVFIVVSGFSLGLGPTRRRNDVKHGPAKFYHRRAWRILPPYWIALVLSLLIDRFLLTGALAHLPEHSANLQSLVVFGLLLQDIIPAQTPNGAFWSIAVEAQIYILFPGLIIAAQRYSALVMAVAVLFVVVLAHLLAMTWPPFHRIDHLSPQLLIAFCFGVWAANEVADPTLRLPMLKIGALLSVAIGVFFWFAGVPFVAANFFWVDIVVGIAVAALFVGLTQGPSALGSLLSVWPLSKLGEFAYSLYLTHGALLALILSLLWVGPGSNPYLSYLTASAVVVPTALAIAYIFFLLFERPFLTIRSWAQLREALGLSRKPRQVQPKSLARAPD